MALSVSNHLEAQAEDLGAHDLQVGCSDCKGSHKHEDLMFGCRDSYRS